MKFKHILTGIIALFSISLVSAYNGWGWGTGSSPLEILDNEWVQFIAIFIILFGIIYFSLNKTFGEEKKGLGAVVSLAITLLISLAIARRGWLYSYTGDALGSWVTILAIFLAIGFLIKVAHDNFGTAGVIVSIIIVWIFIRFGDPYAYSPYIFTSPAISTIIGIFSSVLGLIIAIIIGAILANITPRRKSPLEYMLKGLTKKES